MSLTAQEEQFLRKQIRDSSPMVSVNPVPPPSREFVAVPPSLLESWRNAPKLQPADLNVDNLVQDKLRCAGFKGSPGEFYSRIGVGRAELVKMSHSDIRAAIERARERDDIRPPAAAMAISPAATPPRRAIVMVGD
jgi:hypothetical protein